jgi:hypothetical protein
VGDDAVAQSDRPRGQFLNRLHARTPTGGTAA